MKKYKLTTNKKFFLGVTLHQIEAIVDIPSKGVKKGDLGGWIEKEDNLSHEGDAWVFEDAQVYGNAQVYGDAWVYGNAQVYGDAWVYGNAKVYGDAWVTGIARVFGDAWVYGNAKVYGDAWVYGNAQVYGNARVSGDAWVSGNAEIKTTKDYLVLGPVGSNRYITITRSNGHVRAGCFIGDLSAFIEAVDAKYQGEGDYYPAIEYIKTWLNG